MANRFVSSIEVSINRSIHQKAACEYIVRGINSTNLKITSKSSTFRAKALHFTDIWIAQLSGIIITMIWRPKQNYNVQITKWDVS
jgi:hypothetical protein